MISQTCFRIRYLPPVAGQHLRQPRFFFQWDRQKHISPSSFHVSGAVESFFSTTKASKQASKWWGGRDRSLVQHVAFGCHVACLIPRKLRRFSFLSFGFFFLRIEVHLEGDGGRIGAEQRYDRSHYWEAKWTQAGKAASTGPG